ncbi:MULTISPECIES: lasso peptide isopeptide bond-forming cyclase [Protofrankia]|uniref:Asparagine synthase n=1 Tax=Candidatus Protofrankia datiscae TaxID=2716812 RepID=F8B1A9_9ACTN|nr:MULTISPECIES: lasso peptide isopeptide bond-forming cyclase [Protofrankia]AEH09778.1 asparagine synthase [Candidatus Protofrankia datiscae]
MTGLPSPGTPWFLTLPDAGHLAGAVSPVAERAPRTLRYRSGRPWLLGDWSDNAVGNDAVGDTVVVAEAGTSRLALIGCCPVSAAHLTRALTRIREVTALDILISSLPGSFHVVADIDGHRRVQGTASGLRRVFHTVLDGQVIASDRADMLAACVRGELDPTAVALSLLDPSAPYPLDDRPMWRGVEVLAPDHFLLADRDGRARTVRWWRRPEPVLSLETGAPLLRGALTEAVAARAGAVGGSGGTVSCDLSGGLDSAAVCFLTARNPVTLVAYTGIGRDPGDDDPEWVDLAVAGLPTGRPAGLPGMVHEVLPRDELPLVYDGIMTADEALDRPFPGITDRAKILTGLRRVALYHPRVHLTGLGGDEVVQGTSNYLPALLRRRPWTAVDRFRGFRIQHRWPLWAGLWMLQPRGYRTYLAQLAAQVTGSRPMPGLADLDWADTPRLPRWLTPHAVTLVREALEALVDSAAPPLAGTRDGHHDLLSIRTAAGATRLFCQLAAPTTVTPAAPFLDDRVIEAALAVRPEERTTPWEYKPLLKEAMRGIVPDRSLRRVTKAEGSAEEAAGLDAHRDQLLALCENSRLADLGLVDPEKLREYCRYSHAPEREHESLHQTFACETWLRVLTGDRAAGHPLGAA